jgi:hypothetical protein
MPSEAQLLVVEWVVMILRYYCSTYMPVSVIVVEDLSLYNGGNDDDDSNDNDNGGIEKCESRRDIEIRDGVNFS